MVDPLLTAWSTGSPDEYPAGSAGPSSADELLSRDGRHWSPLGEPWTDLAADLNGPLPIEDYGLIGDCTSAALVGRDGSVDWLCWPRFDSPSCFSALLGDARHGRWSIVPASDVVSSSRSYRGDTMVLETVFETSEGAFALIDFMPVNVPDSSLVRIVEGRRGKCDARMNMTIRFDYGSSVPWVTRLEDGSGIVSIAGPNLAVLRTSVELRGEDLSTAAEFTVAEGERVAFVLTYGPSHRPPPPALDPLQVLRGHGSVLDRLGGPVHVSWSPAGCRAALAPDLEGHDVRGDRRHRGGTDDVLARAARRPAELGLPVLLGA